MAGLPPDLFASLTGADTLRALFTALGYEAQEQIAYSARTLDWPDNIAVDLRGRSFELLADTDDGFFQVLLLAPHTETQGLSAALIQRLYATIEQRGNEAILVLPAADWGALDLVLLADQRPLDQRKGPPSTFLRFSFDARALRSHQQIALELLAVHGAGPGEATERVTRAFRRAQQERFFRSVSFFSTYYLERRMFTDPTPVVRDTWAALSAQMPSLQTSLAGVATPDALTALGWTLVPAPLAGQPQRLRAGSRDVALVATLPADHPLDQPLSAASYPQLELIAALEQERQAGGLTWAILTNGRTWRLYSHLTASISGAFYEVDLADLLAYGSPDDLRYLAGFFGADGLSGAFVGAVFASSQMLAKDVGENLKQVVFAQVFGLLANAIADDLKRRGEYEGSDAQRRLIFRTTLILLYRMLFVLYAESMRLLPTMHPPYYANSLTYLLSDIALQPFTATHLRKPMTPTAYWAWDRLRDLFASISQGRADWGVPKYNGGLFSSGAVVNGAESPHKEPHRLLARVQLGAMDLCKALDLLGRDPLARAATSQDEVRRLIDYAGLDVRRLGSIYEGLLEFQLVEAAGGALELKHTREERKASGSYYTPDYIVAYIVEQAVGPVLEERAKQFAALMERIPAAQRELERTERQLENGRLSYEKVTAEREAARKQLEDLEHEAVESLLDLKILDPAMGSGHFLVSSVNFVTDRLIVILNRHKAGNPILKRLEGIRKQIRASLRDQGVDTLIADAQLDDVNLLRRLVMKRCVFGVDLNDMAVELARLSLWLNSFTVGAPLNFLDHHLKWGNSLIGARVQAVQKAMVEQKKGGLKQIDRATNTITARTAFQFDIFGQGSAFAEMLNLGSLIEELVEIADANAQQVEESERIYAAYEQQVVPIKRLLDLWVTQSFGSKEANDLIRLHSGKDEDVRHLIEALMGQRTLAPGYQKAVAEARALFGRHRFLHWDLDFPEVFIDLRRRDWKPVEQAGFDAVVGNPPYVSNWELTEYEKSLPAVLESMYETVATGHWDMYILFVYQSMTLLKSSGLISYIVPSPFGTEKYASGLRGYILKNAHLVSLTGFGEHAVFEEVSRQYIIFVLSFSTEYCARTKIIKFSNDRFLLKGEVDQEDFTELSGSAFRIDLEPIDFITKKKMDGLSVLLGEICHVNPGVVAHSRSDSPKKFGKDDNISRQPASVGWKKYLQGDSMNRYEVLWYGDYINYDENRDYFHRPKFSELFEFPKLMFRGISGEDNTLIVHLDRNGYYANHSVVVVVKPIPGTPASHSDINPQGDYSLLLLEFILSLTASKLLTRYFANFHKTGTLQGSYSHVYPEHIRQLPIRRITFTTPELQRTALVDEAKALYERGLLTSGTPTSWRGWREHWAALWAWEDARLPQLPDGAPDNAREQSDAVHDLLAHLAERMIELHKQKQAGAAAFTGWLEQETGSAVEDWGLKTVVQSFWEQPWEELERALQKNRGRFMQAAGMRGKQADAAIQPLVRVAQGRWEAARRGLAPTIAAITATDRLIDLLVYRLYGLTDEEIDLVEGGRGRGGVL